MITNAIAAAALAVLFIELGFPQRIKTLIWKQKAHMRRLKPFDCQLCLAWWLGIALTFFGTKSPFLPYTVVQAVLCGAMAALLAVFIHKKLNE